MQPPRRNMDNPCGIGGGRYDDTRPLYRNQLAQILEYRRKLRMLNGMSLLGPGVVGRFIFSLREMALQ